MPTPRIDTAILYDLPPFARQVLEFPKLNSEPNAGEVHLFVGENGTGKTRLLCLLAAACGNQAELDARVQRPTKNFVTASDESSIWVYCGPHSHIHSIAASDKSKLIEYLVTLGQLKVTPTGAKHKLLANEKGESSLALAFRGSVRISDAEIKPLGPVSFGAPENNLRFERLQAEDALFGQCMANLKIRAGMFIASRPSESFNRNVRIADRLEEAVSHVTGRDFYFVVEDSPQLQLRVTWGEKRMFLSQLPDGLRAIIGWLVACVAKIESFHPTEENPLDLPVVLIIDEPESHLHPAWQRKLMPALQHLLPNAQIFVATHSPFVISSVNHGFYYVLRADEEGVVTIDPAKPCSKGDTYLDVVQDILGVQEWYDVETEEQLNQFRSARDVAKRTPTAANMEAMRTLAMQISERSESLKDMMARELSQYDRQLAAVTGRSDK